MQVYAAQVETMDRGIGRVLDALERSGRLDETLVVFLSDNSGCAEVLQPAWMDEAPDRIRSMRTRTRSGERAHRGNTPASRPGPESTYASYGREWANLSNTPFREYKHWVHEGGIATPFIAHWPGGLSGAGAIRHRPHQLPDVMATVLEVTGAPYPDSWPGRDPLPPEGTSMLATWRGEGPAPDADKRLLYWEHEGNAAVRRGRWKLVRRHPGDWELYDMQTDRAELVDAAAHHPALVDELGTAYESWAERCGVLPRDVALREAARERSP